MTKILLVDDSKFLRMATERTGPSGIRSKHRQRWSERPGAGAVRTAGRDSVGHAAAWHDRPRGFEGPEERSRNDHDPDRGVHWTVPQERGALAAGRSLRVPGKIGTGTRERKRCLPGGIGGHPAATRSARTWPPKTKRFSQHIVQAGIPSISLYSSAPSSCLACVVSLEPVL